VADTFWKGKRALSRGSRIFYREEGAGPHLLLVHGWTGNSFQWRKVLPELAKTHRVLAMDLPGSGLSDKPRIDYTIRDYLSYIREFVDEIGFRPFCLAGTSFGGFLSTRYCLEYPEDVRALVLLNSSGVRARVHWLFTLSGLPVFRYLVPWALMLPRDLKYWVLARIYPRGMAHRILLKEYRYTTLTLRSWAGLRAAVRSYVNITEKDLVDSRLSEIGCPTLICWGERDTALPPEMGEIFHRGIRGSRLRTIPGCGHNIPEEKPEAVLREMERFFQDLAFGT
jgi:pimeloyl-ACP methyl ester carboxylesterase